MNDRTGTVPAMVRAVAEHADLPFAQVRQRAQALQNAGILPVHAGAWADEATPRDLACLLLALPAQPIRTAPDLCKKLFEFCSLGTGGFERQQLGRYLETLIADEWKTRGKYIETRSPPTIIIDMSQDRAQVKTADRSTWFYPEDDFLERQWLFAVRQTFEIPLSLFTRVGRDLGHCRIASA